MHARERRLLIGASYTLLILGVVLFIVANRIPQNGTIAILAFLACVIVSGVMSSSVRRIARAEEIGREYIFLENVSEAYLRKLPQWPEPLPHQEYDTR
jgi:hypothetical protein